MTINDARKLRYLIAMFFFGKNRLQTRLEESVFDGYMAEIYKRIIQR